MNAIRLRLVLSVGLAASACGDLSGVSSPGASTATGAAQTAGSTVSILDAQPGC